MAKKNKKDKKINDFQQYIFTLSARDVMDIYNKKLSDYMPVLISGFCEHGGGSMTYVKEQALEDLVNKAKELNCRFVTDVKPIAGSYSAGAFVEYIGTGLIKRK